MATIQLQFVDWLIIGLYFVAIIGIGLYLKRFTKTGEDFFLAQRGVLVIAEESKMNEAQKSPEQAGAEPLPIWFFVGLILGVYGLIILWPAWWATRTRPCWPKFARRCGGAGSCSWPGPC